MRDAPIIKKNNNRAQRTGPLPPGVSPGTLRSEKPALKPRVAGGCGSCIKAQLGLTGDD